MEELTCEVYRCARCGILLTEEQAVWIMTGRGEEPWCGECFQESLLKYQPDFEPHS